MSNKYVDAENIRLATSSQYDEKWLQGKISENPNLLGIINGLSTLAVEQKQHNGGRLDLLLEDENGETRYCVEVQLGATDAEHIIRTIEYWDNERSRNPHIDHIAVIVAEDVTTRFLNVIALFNKNIPLIAVQLKAYKVEEYVTLIGTKVLDLRKNVGEDVKVASQPADRNYWVKRASASSLKIVDDMLKMVAGIATNTKVELNYTKPYISITVDGISDNFIVMKPTMKGHVHIDFRIDRDDNDEFLKSVEESEIFHSYTKWGSFKLTVSTNDFESNKEMIKELLNRATKNSRIS